MQFEDYVVAELSKINAHQAISTTLSWVGRPCCGAGTLNADYATVKPLTCVFLESRVASNRWPQINSLSHDAAFAMVATHVSMNRRCQPPLASIIESNLIALSRFNSDYRHARKPTPSHVRFAPRHLKFPKENLTGAGARRVSKVTPPR